MIKFGLKEPKRIAKQHVEKYDYPVMTLEPIIEGAKHKIGFNKACCEQMGFDDSTVIVFGKTEYYTIFMDGQKLPEEYDKMKRYLTKGNRTVSSKEDYELLLKNFHKLEVRASLPYELKVIVEYSNELDSNIGKLVYMGDKTESLVVGDVPMESYESPKAEDVVEVIEEAQVVIEE